MLRTNKCFLNLVISDKSLLKKKKKKKKKKTCKRLFYSLSC